MSSSLERMPPEILHKILDDVTGGSPRELVGKTASWYSQTYAPSLERRQRELYNLCLTSRCIREVASVILYRQLLLPFESIHVMRRPLKEARESRDRLLSRILEIEKARHRNTTEDTRAHIGLNFVPSEGGEVLGLLLRTLLERPHLRHLVRHLGCPFPLTIVSTAWRPLRGTSYPDYQSADALFLQQCAALAESGHDRAVMDHAGLLEAHSGPEAVSKTRERAFAAILLLTPRLRSVAYAQTPSSTLCRYPDAERGPAIPNLMTSSMYYTTLNSILESAYQDPYFSPMALQELESVRFTNTRFPNDATRRAGEQGPLTTYPIDPRGILLAPNVVELRSNLDNGNNPLSPEDFDRLRLKRLTMRTGSQSEDFVSEACARLPLTHLTVIGFPRKSTVANQYALAERIRSWNKGLLSVRDTLTYLDIGRNIGNTLPSFEAALHFNCLAKMNVLERLRIGLPLIMTRAPQKDGEPRKPFCKILPARLIYLDIFDYYSCWVYEGGPAEHCGQHSEWPGMEKGQGEPPSEYLKRLKALLLDWAAVCNKTHPTLKRVRIWGNRCVPLPRDLVPAVEAVEDPRSRGEKYKAYVDGDGVLREALGKAHVRFEAVRYVGRMHMGRVDDTRGLVRI